MKEREILYLEYMQTLKIWEEYRQAMLAQLSVIYEDLFDRYDDIVKQKATAYNKLGKIEQGEFKHFHLMADDETLSFDEAQLLATYGMGET